MSGSRLIVCEKPSVARDIARVLGLSRRADGYIEGDGVRVSWCLGHLVELREPHEYDPAWKAWRLEDLPIVPAAFALRPRADSDRGAAGQWETLRRLLADPATTGIVNACDAGREGELIFAYAYELSGATAPVERLWVSSMTDEAISRGFERLRPAAAVRDLEMAARSRSEADWLVGINATRAMTVKVRQAGADQLLSIGRVQTPTLAMIVGREKEIEAFRVETFWQIVATFAAEKGTWEAKWTEGEGERKKDRLFDRAAAEAVVERVRGRPATVVGARRKKERQPPPFLYDLTNLQKTANQRFRFSAKKTLDLAQALYEEHKLLTYPRTDSRHLGSDQVAELPGVLSAVAFGPYQETAAAILERGAPTLGGRFVDDAEVRDHHAILPTAIDPTRRNLSPDEKRIYDLVVRRFLGAFEPDAVFAATDLVAAVGDDRFHARGRTRLDAGWQAIDPPPTPKKKEVLLPAVEVGDAAETVEVRLHEGRTKPPRRFNEATLLGSMERAGEELEEEEYKRAMKQGGLGTPATRAAIIETLLGRGFIVRDGRHLLPTPIGRALIDIVPVDVLLSPSLTGQWEARLSAMAEGKDRRSEFMADVAAFTGRVVEAIRAADLSRPAVEPFAAAERGEAIGDCPLCGQTVHALRRGWGCRACDFRIRDQVASRAVSRRMAGQLLADRRTQVVKGFKSRQGRLFEAALVVEEDGSIGFEFPAGEVLGSCPACGKPVRIRGQVYSCDSGRECPFVVFAETSGRSIDVQSVRQLLAGGRSRVVKGFRGKDGKAFDGVLEWSGRRVEVRAVDERVEAGVVGECPSCAGPVRFVEGTWRCGGCAFSFRSGMMQRELRPVEVAELLADGRTRRLHGFRQRNGAPCKAAFVLDDDGQLAVDFTKPDDEPPASTPPGGPRPAFGERIDCPLCILNGSWDPGYVVAGRSAWGCSAWRDGCVLRVPFAVDGVALDEDEARRLLGKKRATRYVDGRRLVLSPEAEHGWTVETRA